MSVGERDAGFLLVRPAELDRVDREPDGVQAEPLGRDEGRDLQPGDGRDGLLGQVHRDIESDVQDVERGVSRGAERFRWFLGRGRLAEGKSGHGHQQEGAPAFHGKALAEWSDHSMWGQITNLSGGHGHVGNPSPRVAQPTPDRVRSHHRSCPEARMSATATPPKAPPGPIAPPEEQFWEKYSPHYEFPLSGVGSVLMNVGTLAVFLMALWLLARSTASDKEPLPIRPWSGSGTPRSGRAVRVRRRRPKENVDTPHPTDHRTRCPKPSWRMSRRKSRSGRRTSRPPRTPRGCRTCRRQEHRQVERRHPKEAAGRGPAADGAGKEPGKE